MSLSQSTRPVTLSDLAHIELDAGGLTPRGVAQRRITLARASNLISVDDAIRLFAEIGFDCRQAMEIMSVLQHELKPQSNADFVVQLKSKLRKLSVNRHIVIDDVGQFDTARQVAYWMSSRNPELRFASRTNSTGIGGRIYRIDHKVPKAEAYAQINLPISTKGPRPKRR